MRGLLYYCIVSIADSAKQSCRPWLPSGPMRILYTTLNTLIENTYQVCKVWRVPSCDAIASWCLPPRKSGRVPNAATPSHSGAE